MTDSAFDGSSEILLKQKADLALLKGLLVEEKEVLGQYTPEALENITAKKEALLSQIQSTDEMIANSAATIREIQSGIHNEIMAEIEQLMSECKSQNEINGAIIQQSQFTVNRMRTSILEGQGKSSLTYNEKAKTSTGVNTLNIKA